ncbi:MAG TPA: PEGA domain-containing protein [Candidatus Saccharimonadales bacterium]
MDFLDPKKQKAHRARMLIGYVLIGFALIIATTILLYQAYGFGIDNGKIVQNGLVFVSSHPGGANILVNGDLKGQTNSRLNLPAGQYTFKIQRPGYRTWQRSIGVEGGSVEHFDYPFLIPSSLKTTTYATYSSKPDAALQSPDQRWLLVPRPGVFGTFDMYDLAHPKNAATTVALPGNVLTASAGAQSWQLVEWSSDSTHVLLRHTFVAANNQTASEYVLVNRSDPTQSVNLSTTLGQTPTNIELKNGAYNQYYLYNQTAQTLTTATLSSPTPVALAQHVLAFETSGSNDILYIDGSPITSGANAGKVTVDLKQGNTTYTLGHLASASSYVLNLAQYAGDWYVAYGAATDGKVDVYENPVSQLTSGDSPVIVPVAVLKVNDPQELEFSTGDQFLMAENGSSFASFDALTGKTYTYTLPSSLGTITTPATWIDNAHLAVSGNGKLVMLDFDGANRQTLVAADASLTPIFDPNYHTMYAFAAQPSTSAYTLTSTSLLTPADQ